VSGFVPIATVFGMLVSNLGTGWLASRTGRYRGYTIFGTSLAAAGLLVMALLPVGTPLWVPMVVMFAVGIGTGSFMSLVIAVVQGAVPRNETGTITATTNLVRQMGSTLGTAVIGGVIGAGVAAQLPASLEASSLTPDVVHGSAPAVQAEVAQIYGDVFVPVFAALAITYAIGIVAAILLPPGRLSDEPAPATTEPATEPATA
jgi:MFS family permease